ncbi:hypothetical protein MLD38_018279 [Melastoma candidum]|uniref:Uncharacterized protein n=1 Tax=Melastoma candidum TaxID=119954 RepID=A0ACB9QT89_9MYRT|nr:hypothetical protein MLD38_018279 [Melastoma candidum]
MTKEATQKSGPPKIVASVTAFKLAEQWVNNMSKVEMDPPKNIESEGRPSRLGLGAKFTPQLRTKPSNDPVEKRLYSQLEARKRKAAKESEELSLPARDTGNESGSEGEPESRAASFSKKRAPTTVVTSLTKKKHK